MTKVMAGLSNIIDLGFDKRILVLAVIASMIIPIQAANSTLYSIDGLNDGSTLDLHTIDKTNGSILASIPVTLVGSNPAQIKATGLAYDVTNDILYGVIIPDKPFSNRVLVTIDPATGDATQIGSSFINDGTENLRIADLAFGPNDVLYGITGGFAPIPGSNDETLFTIDLTTAIATKVCQMPPPLPTDRPFGEAIAFNANGNLFRISGSSEDLDTIPLQHPRLYQIDLVASISSGPLVDCSIVNGGGNGILLTHSNGDQLFFGIDHFNSLTYDEQQNVLLGSGGFTPFSFFSITESGSVTLLGSTLGNDIASVFGDLAGIETPVVGVGFALLDEIDSASFSLDQATNEITITGTDASANQIFTIVIPSGSTASGPVNLSYQTPGAKSVLVIDGFVAGPGGKTITLVSSSGKGNKVCIVDSSAGASVTSKKKCNDKPSKSTVGIKCPAIPGLKSETHSGFPEAPDPRTYTCQRFDDINGQRIFTVTGLAFSGVAEFPDEDDDDISDEIDNCPATANADQADANGDGIGDVCDDTPRTIKEDALVTLQAKLTEDINKKTEKDLKKAIKSLQKSLENSLWADDSHLVMDDGKKVFKEEKKTVKKLMNIVKKDKETFEFIAEISDIILSLVDADAKLATIALDDAQAFAGDKKADKQIEKAEKELGKAQKDLDKEKFDKAIKHYEKAWKHVIKAIDDDDDDDDDEDE